MTTSRALERRPRAWRRARDSRGGGRSSSWASSTPSVRPPTSTAHPSRPVLDVLSAIP